MADISLKQSALTRALDALQRAFLAGPLSVTDPHHELAFRVVRAHMEAAGTLRGSDDFIWMEGDEEE